MNADTTAENRKPEEACGILKFAVAVFLTWIAGFVDAVGYLTFARVYTANMSGNSVALGIALGSHQWMSSFFRLWPILLYVIGLFLGRLLVAIGVERGTRRVACVGFGCEVALLGVASLLSGPPYNLSWQYLPVALLAAAMGIQSAILTQFSSLTLYTGFVTGTLLKMSEQLVAYGTSLVHLLKRGESFSRAMLLSFDQDSFRLGLFLAFTWTTYVVGAAIGAWQRSLFDSRALLVPVLGLMVLILVDLRRPLAVQEENEQSRLA